MTRTKQGQGEREDPYYFISPSFPRKATRTYSIPSQNSKSSHPDAQPARIRIQYFYNSPSYFPIVLPVRCVVMDGFMENGAASDDGLRGALVTSLENRGAAKSIKAKIRAEVFASLNNEAIAPPRALPGDVYLAAEILKDFLVRMKCENTLSVLTQELGLDSQGSMEREFLLQELGMDSSSKEGDVPVLMLMMQTQVENAVKNKIPDQAAGGNNVTNASSS